MTQYYNGNPNLKGAGVPIQFSHEQLAEYVKCSEDPIYFIRNYCKIVSLDRGLINFELFKYQERFIDSIHNNRFVISMQPRQMGKSQTVAGYILWYVLFNENKTVAILANKWTAAREIMSRIQMMFEYLPAFLQQGVKTWNKGDIELENGSNIFTGATSSSGIRGKSVNFLYVDEVAIIANTVADEFFTSTYPTISSGETTKIVLTSTPLGYNHFWKFWKEAEDGINGFIPVEVKYHEHPKRDEAWAKQQLKILGELKYTQEVMCSFIGSASTLIRGDFLAKIPMFKPYYSKDGLDLYEPPKKANRDTGTKDHSYVMVVDTSKGSGGDYSTFQLIDVTNVPYKVVGKYRDNHISPLLFPSIIYKIAREYNDAYVLFEINFGEQVPHILYYEMEYENFIFVARTKKGQEASAGFGGNGRPQLGVSTDKKTKRIGCTNLKELIESGKLETHDSDTLAELSTFIERKDSYAADDGYHDDLVMPLVLFAWFTTQNQFKDISDVDLRKAIYQKQMEAIDAETLPLGGFWDGQEDEIEHNVNF